MTLNYIEKLRECDHRLHLSPISDQVDAILKIDHTMQQKGILIKAPQPLGLPPDAFEALAEKVPHDLERELKTFNGLTNNLRSYLSWHYGVWSLPNLSAALTLKKAFGWQTGLEIMAGNAYWSLALNHVGIKMIATDSLQWAQSSMTGRHPFFEVKAMEAREALMRYDHVDFILCSWAPDFSPEDWSFLKQWRQHSPRPTLLFIGEKRGATNSRLFWQQAHLQSSLPLQKVNQQFNSFDFIQEQFFMVR